MRVNGGSTTHNIVANVAWSGLSKMLPEVISIIVTGKKGSNAILNKKISIKTRPDHITYFKTEEYNF